MAAKHGEAKLWLDLFGGIDSELASTLQDVFGIHSLAIEDATSNRHRPKFEEYESNLALVLKMAEINCDHARSIDQLGLFLGSDFVITVQTTEEDCLSAVRHRLESGEPKVRARTCAYLAYLLLEAVIQGFFPILEKIGDELEDVEDTILERPSEEAVKRIHDLRRELLQMRRVVWPQRDAVSQLVHSESDLIGDAVLPYFRDSYDHTIQVMDVVETYRELCSDLTDLYLSSISNRMNEIMKVLTVISALFIPLTFVVGVYGMNFDTNAGPLSMPELRHPLGYVVCWLVLIAIAVGQLWFFIKKGWIGKGT